MTWLVHHLLSNTLVNQLIWFSYGVPPHWLACPNKLQRFQCAYFSNTIQKQGLTLTSSKDHMKGQLTCWHHDKSSNKGKPEGLKARPWQRRTCSKSLRHPTGAWQPPVDAFARCGKRKKAKSSKAACKPAKRHFSACPAPYTLNSLSLSLSLSTVASSHGPAAPGNETKQPKALPQAKTRA